jgi:hypothetical protein
MSNRLPKRRKPMYPLDISGITGESMQKFMFNENANEQTMAQLVGEIPPQTEVIFYDQDFYSPSDPGAYVAFRQVDDQYVMKRSNHGWSKKWEAISVERLVSYLSKCAKYNMGPDFPNMMRAYPNQVDIPSQVKAPSLKNKKWWQFWK